MLITVVLITFIKYVWNCVSVTLWRTAFRGQLVASFSIRYAPARRRMCPQEDINMDTICWTSDDLGSHHLPVVYGQRAVYTSSRWLDKCSICSARPVRPWKHMSRLEALATWGHPISSWDYAVKTLFETSNRADSSCQDQWIFRFSFLFEFYFHVFF